MSNVVAICEYYLLQIFSVSVLLHIYSFQTKSHFLEQETYILCTENGLVLVQYRMYINPV